MELKLHLSLELAVEIFLCATRRSVYGVAFFCKEVLELFLRVLEFHVLEVCKQHQSVLYLCFLRLCASGHRPVPYGPSPVHGQFRESGIWDAGAFGKHF